MKIVFLPGVGFNEDICKYEKFLSLLKKNIDFEFEIVNWKHDYLMDAHENHHIQYDDFGFKKTKSWFSEVVLDFQHVLLNVSDMDIPEADVYMGHSAGSILALANAKNKHCILYGSPVKLIDPKIYENGSFINACNCSGTKVLNFIHKNDIIAYPIEKENVENYYFKSPFYKCSSFNPISAHRSYWSSSEVQNKTIDKLIEWRY